MSTTYRNTAVTVGTSSTELAPARRGRLYLEFTNVSNEDVYVSIGAAAVSGSGIYLPPNQGRAIENLDKIDGQVNAICASGSKSVAICEIYE